MCFSIRPSDIFAFLPVELIKSQFSVRVSFWHLYSPCLSLWLQEMYSLGLLGKIVCIVGSIWFYVIPVANENLFLFSRLCCWFVSFGRWVRWLWHSSCFLLLCVPIRFYIRQMSLLRFLLLRGFRLKDKHGCAFYINGLSNCFNIRFS